MDITPQEALEKIDSEHALLIDVRSPAEFRGLHATEAKNHELSKLTSAYIEEHILSNGEIERPIILICQTGNRASIAAAKFKR